MNAATPLVKQAVSGLKNRHDNPRVLAMAMAAVTKRKKKATTYAAYLIRKAVEDAAATRIQAAFRSFLVNNPSLLLHRHDIINNC